MRNKGKRSITSRSILGRYAVILTVVILTAGCSPGPELASTPTPTSSTGGGAVPPTAASASKCEGLSGAVEMQVLVGPAEAVGLEPVAVGTIPFAVTSAGGVYLAEGGGSVQYEDVLEQQWGTYSVRLDQQAEVSGECSGDGSSAILDLVLTVSGDQMVEVRAEGFSGDYPWSGTHEFSLSFPAEEGASAEGEGWVFVLHVD